MFVFLQQSLTNQISHHMTIKVDTDGATDTLKDELEITRAALEEERKSKGEMEVKLAMVQAEVNILSQFVDDLEKVMWGTHIFISLSL